MVKNSSSSKIEVKVEKRETLGRKVKSLRQKGILPANIYGKKVKSLAIQLHTKEFSSVWEKVGETGVIHLKVVGEQKDRPALIHNLHLDPVTDLPLHIDFHQVDLTVKVTSNIPIEVVGTAPAVEQKIGVLIQLLNEVEVEALPTDLPDHLNIDISSLKEVDQGITVKELKVPAGVEILTDLTQVLAKIEPPSKEEEAPAPAEGEAVEGEAPAEGEETKKEEETTEKTAEDKSGRESKEAKKEESKSE